MPHFKYTCFTSNDEGQVREEHFLASAKEGTEDYIRIYFNDHGPAVVDFDGTQIYYMNGYIGRADPNEPTIIYKDGMKEYWTNGILGRKNGPAIEYSTGGCDWIWKKVYHRSDGPARVFEDGTKHYYYEGKKIEAKNDEEFKKKVKYAGLMF